MKFLLLFIGYLLLSLKVSAGETVQENPSGSCGDNCKWEINLTTQELSIGLADSGVTTGSIQDYPRTERDGETTTTAPWRDYINNVKSLTIDEGITSIGAWAFEDMHIKTAQLPSTLTAIKDGAFHSCSLNGLDIPDSVTSIGAWAISHTDIKELILPENLETIGGSAFGGNNKLTDKVVIIPDSVTQLSENAFYSAYRNTTVTQIICSSNLMEKCKKTAAKTGASVMEYTKMPNGRFQVGNNLYLSLSDMQIGHVFTPKRIYTVQEAERASKKTGNRVIIRYR